MPQLAHALSNAQRTGCVGRMPDYPTPVAIMTRPPECTDGHKTLAIGLGPATVQTLLLLELSWSVQTSATLLRYCFQWRIVSPK